MINQIDNHKFTDKCGCVHNDRIKIELSPSDLRLFYQTMKTQAKLSCDYLEQKEYHRVTDSLSDYLNKYEEDRMRYDKKEKK